MNDTNTLNLVKNLAQKYIKGYAEVVVAKVVAITPIEIKDKVQEQLRCLSQKMEQFTQPKTDELVTSLILHTASLAIPKGEFVELAPIKGSCGSIQLYGNCLPVFKYRVFDKKRMEFILVSVEISKPDRIHFISAIDSPKTDPESHGKIIETTEKYKEPFQALSAHLFKYFPLVRERSESDVII